MKILEELLAGKGHHIISIAPDASVYEALALMAETDVGALVVLDDGKLAGIISERDYARKIILTGRTSRTAKVAEIMTADVTCATLRTSIEDAMALMTEHRIRHLPVLDQAELVGVVSIGDLVKTIIADQRFVIEQLEHYIAG